ncbi:MAG TPA: NAD(P)H-hydrate dehydratase [Chthoniobacterales bacterium]
MLLSSAEMRAVEEDAFARGVNAEDLMDRAGLGIAEAILAFVPGPAHVIAVCGKGNNAGDVLVAARHLARRGWNVEADLVFPEHDLSPLAAKKLTELRASLRFETSMAPSLVLLDGLLGIGARGAPREPIALAIRRIDALRQQRGAFVVAADLPSGLDADTGEAAESCVVADLTVTIGHPKAGLLADAATAVVGRLALVPLDELATSEGDAAELVTPLRLQSLLPPRPFDSHKGTWGRIGILAGSRGTLGAARLCAEGALRAGAGLVTLYALPDCYELLAATMPPEVMVRPVARHTDALADRLDAIAIGPGIGSPAAAEILPIITGFSGPMVVDADALNLLARTPGAWQKMAGPRLFTPHPGEMARLFPESRSLSRRATAEKFAGTHHVTVLLKGARTVIAEAGAPTVFNTTGNPGMGSGGMGDVLSGVCATFLGQGHSPREAAMLGAWICGRAAERFVFGPGGSPEGLVASDVIHRLGETMQDIRTGRAI